MSSTSLDVDDDQRRRDLRRMKRVASSLLVLATLVFLVARRFEVDHSWVGYVRAFAEAGMVGAIADWFAVTALFRHPLGIPIPHTAIIPNRKDDIGRGLGGFVESNFLTAEVVEEKLRATPLAARLGEWLAEPRNAARVGDQTGTVVRAVLDTLRDAEVQEAIEQSIATRVRATPVGPPVGRIIELAMADGRHQELLSSVLRRVVEALEENRDSMRARLDNESPWWVPEPIDDRIFAKLFDGISRFLSDISDDPDHEMRRTFDERVREFAVALEASPQMRQRAEDLKEEVLEHPALRAWSASVWADLKASLLRRSADPNSSLRRRLDSALVDLGERLRDDTELQAKVDDWIVSLAVAVVEQSRGEIGELIASTVARWDADESADRIEVQVGRDLQFIRINGTVVGGLAGLVIHTFGQFL